MDYPYINIHTHRRTGEGIEVVSLMAGARGTENGSGNYPRLPFSVGIHPWQLGEVDLEAALREVETAPACAIGEIGLDYAVPGDHSEQKMVFATQLRIAEARGLPVVLHCVRAFEPTMEILAGFRLPAVIFHGFKGSREQAARAVRAGYYLSFGERSFDSSKTVEALAQTPLENIFLETDTAPGDVKAAIGEIYARTAGIFHIGVTELIEQLYKNYERVVVTH